MKTPAISGRAAKFQFREGDHKHRSPAILCGRCPRIRLGVDDGCDTGRMGSMPVLVRCDLVSIENGVHDRCKGLDSWSRGWPRPPVLRRFLMGQVLMQSEPVNPVEPAGLPLAHGARQVLAANLRPTLHIGVHLSAALLIGENRQEPFSQIRLECTNVRFTIRPPPTLPSASVLLRR